MTKRMTRDEVIALMKKRQGSRTLVDFAAELGVSQPYLTDLYQGKRDPGEKLLDALGLDKDLRYVPKELNAAD